MFTSFAKIKTKKVRVMRKNKEQLRHKALEDLPESSNRDSQGGAERSVSGMTFILTTSRKMGGGSHQPTAQATVVNTMTITPEISYTEIYHLLGEGRVVVFDLETSGFGAEDRY